MKKGFFVLLVSFLFAASTFAQTGLRIHAGGSALDNEDSVLNPDGPYLGWHVGGDFQIAGDDMSILLGGRYTTTKYTTNKAIYNSTSAPEIVIVSTRVGLAFNFIKINRNIGIIGRVLGSIDYVFNEPIKSSGVNAGYKQYASTNTVASAVGGLGLRVGSLTFDVEYGHGLFNIVSNEKNTKPTHYSVSAGYFF